MVLIFFKMVGDIVGKSDMIIFYLPTYFMYLRHLLISNLILWHDFFILNKVCSQVAMKNSIFASFCNSIIALQFLSGGKMIKWKNIAVEKYPGWRSLWWRSFPSLCSLNFSYYFSLILLLLQLFLQLTTNNYNKKVGILWRIGGFLFVDRSVQLWCLSIGLDELSRSRGGRSQSRASVARYSASKSCVCNYNLDYNFLHIEASKMILVS